MTIYRVSFKDNRVHSIKYAGDRAEFDSVCETYYNGEFLIYALIKAGSEAEALVLAEEVIRDSRTVSSSKLYKLWRALISPGK